MSRNYYSEINLHYTWHTKESLPLITPEVEEMLFAALREKAARLGGVYIQELGAIPTHVHVALSQPSHPANSSANSRDTARTKSTVASASAASCWSGRPVTASSASAPRTCRG
jgi:REP element-mobilizing transposase RayT